MDTRRFDRHPDRIGRRCRGRGCGAVVHDEARHCHQCGRAVWSPNGLADWWRGVYFPPRCERCRRVTGHHEYAHCPRCGKKTIPRAYERASVPGAVAMAALLAAIVWAAGRVAVEVLATPHGWPGRSAGPAVDVGFGFVGLWLGRHAYRWLRGLRQTAPDVDVAPAPAGRHRHP